MAKSTTGLGRTKLSPELQTPLAQADRIAAKFKSADRAEATAAFKGPWQDHHKQFVEYAGSIGVKLTEREFDPPPPNPSGELTPYAYETCYHWFVTGRKNEYGQIEICDLRRSRKRLDGTLKCVYDCGFFTPA
jgi:hypothetical protein